MASHDLRQRVMRGLRSPFSEVRVWACRSVLQGQVEVDGRDMRLLLRDGSRPVRRMAVRAVGVRRLTAAVPLLIELLDSPDEDLALQAAVALETIGGKTVVKPLQALETHRRRTDELRPNVATPVEPKSIAPFPDEVEEPYGRRSVGVAVVVLAMVGAFVGGWWVGRGGEAKVTAQPSPSPSPLRFDEGTVGGREEVEPEEKTPVPDLPSASEELLLSTARRYLEAGRPREALRLMATIEAANPGLQGLEALKRLARDRYGDIE